METRTERDGLGEFAVPADAYYGIATARAVQNFPMSGQRMPRPLIRALALTKAGAARANRDLGLLDAPMADAIK
ncbi:MAG TPA: lyase family protein, partial [Tepidiformaceae bacterium]|nr:lyase family protein [Tepidiformaceae bacterium]